MPPRTVIPQEVSNSVEFPLAGVDRTRGFEKQPRRPLVDGSHAYTTIQAVNCVAFDPATDRARGGSRPGIEKYGTNQVNGSNSIQEINAVTVTNLVTGGTGTIPGSGVSTPNIIVRKPTSVDLSFGSSVSAWTFGNNAPPAPQVAAIGAVTGTKAFFVGIPSATLGNLPITLRQPTGFLALNSVEYPTGSEPTWFLVSNGSLIAYGTLPGNPSIHSVAVTTDGTSFYACGQNRGTTSPGAGTFFAVKVSAAGAVTWSTPNVGSLTVSTEIANPSTAVVVSGVLYATVVGTGIVQVNATTGVAGSPFVRLSGAAIRDSGAGGNYVMQKSIPSELITPYQPVGQLAAVGNLLAIAVQRNVATNFQKGVVFYDLGSSLFSPAALLGPSITDGDGDAQASPGNSLNFLSLSSDGSHFYGLLGTAGPPISTANNFGVKIHGTTGALTWSTDDFGAQASSLKPSTSLDKVIVSGPALSKFLTPSSGAESGGGLGSNILDLWDAGSVTSTIDTTSEEGSTVGGYNRALAVFASSAGTAKILFQNAWRSVIAGGGSLSSTARVIRSAVNRQKLYIVDDLGANYTIYNPTTNALEAWTPSSGELPEDGIGKKARLIETWRGRTILSGLPSDPNNIFASAVDDSLNWNYSPASQTPTQAFALNTAPQGQIPDVVTAIIPYTDDVLVVGCDHELWQITGDPMAGGKKDRISNQLGVAWGRAWTIDPFGQLYVFSNHCGVYAITPGAQPLRISQPIDSILREIDIRKQLVRLVWNDRLQGMHVWVTNFPSPGPSVHYFWEQRTGGWQPWRFGDNNFNPLTCMTFQGNTGSSRAVLIGSSDGYVRYVTDNAPIDDGVNIESEVWLGPIQTKDMDEIIQKEIQAIFSKSTVAVNYSIHVGNTAEQAFYSPPATSGTIYGGRSHTFPTNRAGHAIYIRLTSSQAWAMELIRERLIGTGAVRRRGS